MAFRVVVEADAKQDVRKAIEWYEKQRPGLKFLFRDGLDATLGRIAGNPLAGAVVLGRVRQRSLSRFPYVVSYLVHNDSVHVIAVLHGHRDPHEWQRRSH